ncbi:MAG: NAD(P)/FAD-dependent oxidoreductase [Planctomycetes bacterium]|jgi:L-2-hydroxyglutarate oxidase LhgO|nr:NAD(P)/FAD-dependent oxidoreductase [Planctomycetota bacterium]MBT4029148.1 NAD(P)/FAD-dependent oxidoreductase [Planctomycetota bacterium]MBT4559229.1 NAD(P)/FAD-dependent oxidoreductase [Planctomycetota bacterium]MBT7012555.1 NAD(P)/FAD-dependent oxidoreductase [Planctomycetota bacterium]MBT7318495.1 NAD(P)/FAD-dependent oxidoreductase [Planctomycetota bacterium]
MTEVDRIPVAIIGAGVVGAACARSIADRGGMGFIFEREAHSAPGTTSRNSGVIHAGIYYPPESLKAELCIAGNLAIYDWCEKHGVGCKSIGKMIVATTQGQEEGLADIFANATASWEGRGDSQLEMLTREQVLEMEPSLTDARCALWSPRTGIVDPHELTDSFLRVAEEGFEVLYHAEVTAIKTLDDGGFQLTSSRGEIQADVVINAAGLYSDVIAEHVGIEGRTIYPCKGDYWQWSAAGREFSHLVYPVKEKGAPGLGVHLTLDLAGRVRLGPNAYFVDSKEDFSPNEAGKEDFRKAAEVLFGAIPDDAMAYDMCGIRPKLRAPDEKVEKDFAIVEPVPGFIDLQGIESPGLTSAIAIGEMVAEMLDGR